MSSKSALTRSGKSSDALIDMLAAEGAAVRPLPRPGVATIGWGLAAAVGTLSPVFFAVGGRADLPQMLRDPRFVCLLAALGGLMLASGYLALAAAVPGRWLGAGSRLMPVLLGLAALAAVASYELSSPGSAGAASFAAGQACAEMVFALALLPAALLFYLLGRRAPLRLAPVGAWAGVAAGAAASLAVCLHCTSKEAAHLVVYHGLPIGLISVACAAGATRLLRW